MTEIFIEGLGVIEIAGDSPTEEESRVILNSIREIDEVIEMETRIGIGPPEPSPVEPQEPAGPQEPVEGPLGLVPTDVRGEVRETVKSAPGLFPLLAEMTPSVIGAGVGGTIGFGLGGPPGALVGGTLGGVAGELIAQEIGVAPTSKTNLALAGAGPVAGRVVGTAARLSGRMAGGAITALPPARVARARVAAKRGAEELQSLGARILEKQKGLLARSATDLYNAARKAGVKILGQNLGSTRRAMAVLRKELQPIKAFPEVKQALQVLKQAEKSLGGIIDFDTFIRVRQAIGAAVGRAQSVEGVRLGGAKKVFAAMSDDLDRLATRQPTKRAARLAKAAITRAKTEFAVRDAERLVARFTLPGEAGITINAKGLLKALTDLANPKHKNFDKNFVAGLGDELPEILKNLSNLVKVTGAGSPGGPGSIVVRGITARMGRTVIGGLIGFGTGGVIGAGAGALIGASGPEMLTAILMSRPAIAFLEAAARAGRGEVSRRVWMVAGQIATRSLGGREEAPFTMLPSILPQDTPQFVQPPRLFEPREEEPTE